MNGSRSRNEEMSPQLLDLIPTDRERHENRDEERSHHKSSEERKLELRLGPPGEEDYVARGRGESLLSLGYSSASINGGQTQQKTASSPWGSTGYHEKKTQNNNQHKGVSSFLQPQPSSANTAVPNSSQKSRTAPGPVVGWPPIRSFRRNLASSSSSKVPPPHQHESQNQHVVEDKVAGKKPVADNNVVGGKGLFVKINMDGVPIGRKVDLNAYDSYEKLSFAVDELFRGLLAAQRDSCGGVIQNKQEEGKAITGLLDGSGEHTLVYEDNEGDRMLVGDVPWHMFVSTVKRLRVLKSSELSAFTLGSKQGKNTS
ncbi:auxin-responsive protein IAA26-like isoform X1 [Prosopis cineraria]|uniref:auxin-responsive protein IAA26-like isoform X1 n=1 Tax=Prosopis cineraria TaxID=364024 RepID=UPI00240EDFCB|nr:auxin-responsive protein IAA26-like isoform X1 [Prosopis cineraria]XP_054782919.1 auxin-responsive protein IAA26-like isoform X1 [Prosopis cineraria]